MSEFRPPRSCSAPSGIRIARAVISVFLAIFAVAVIGNPWWTIPAGAAAVFLSVSAITGWCPADRIGLRRHRATESSNTLGYPEALQKIDLK